MNEPVIRRRRRRQSDVENISLTSDKPIDIDSLRHSDQNQVESPQQNIEQNEDNISSQPRPNISFSAVNEQSINSIRAELLEDSHHSDLTESDYSNDTHDWGEDSYNYSDEYSHFLGRYE